MGLNLPMLLASSQNLAGWNPNSPFSPPNHKAPHIRVSMPLNFVSNQHNTTTAGLNHANTVRNMFSTGGYQNHPSKSESLETIDLNDKSIEENTDDRESPATEIALSPCPRTVAATTSETSSTLPITTTSKTSTTPAKVTTTNASDSNRTRVLVPTPPIVQLDDICHEELDIKQELADIFHAPPPPVAPDSNRSCSSSDENRLGSSRGVDALDDFAQDLRVSAAVAAARGMDFGSFMLPHQSSSRLSQFDQSSRLNSRHNIHQPSTNQMFMNSLLNESFQSDGSIDADRQSDRRINTFRQPTTMQRNESKHDTKSLPAKTINVNVPTISNTISGESEPKDDCDYVGSNVTLKLRSMDRTQRIIAEKLISEVLFYGQFNELEKTAKIEPK